MKEKIECTLCLSLQVRQPSLVLTEAFFLLFSTGAEESVEREEEGSEMEARGKVRHMNSIVVAVE